MSRKGPVVTATLTADTKGFKKGVHEAEGALSKFGHGLGGVGGPAGKLGQGVGELSHIMGKGLALGALAGAAALGEFGKKAVEAFQGPAQAILHFKQVSGSTAIEASKFVAVGKLYGVTAEDLSTAIGKMNKTVGATPEKFKALNIELGKDARGGYDAQKTFLNVVAAYNATNDASKRALIGATAFGKGWQSVVKLLDTGTGKLSDDFAKVRDSELFDDKALEKSEEFRKSTHELGVAMEGLERKIGEALIPTLIKAAEKATDFIDRFASGAHKVKGFLDRLSHDLHQLPGAHDDSKKKAQEAIEIQANVNRIIAESTKEVEKGIAARERADENTKRYASNDGYRDMLLKQADAAKKAKDELSRYIGVIHDLAGDQLGLEGALNNATDSIADYGKTIKETGYLTNDARDALLGAKTALYDYAGQAVATAEKQAELTNRTLTDTQKVDIQIEAYRKFAKTLSPSDPLRKWLDEYINKLLTIPKTATTDISVSTSDPYARAIPGRVNHYADGGVVPGPKGSPQLAIVHGGEEVLRPDQRGGGGGGTVNITQHFPAGVDPRRVNDANRRWAWRNGQAAA